MLFLSYGDTWAVGVLLPPGTPHPAASASGIPPSSARSPAGGQSRSHNFHPLPSRRGLHLLQPWGQVLINSLLRSMTFRANKALLKTEETGIPSAQPHWLVFPWQ